MEQVKINKLLKLGGKRWREYGLDRIYFNNLYKIIKGDKIGDIKAVSDILKKAKFWYDIQEEKFRSHNLYSSSYNLKQMLTDRVNELIGDDNEFTEILSDLDDI